MGIRTIEELNLKNKRILIRVDFNVPLDENGNVVDDTRIKESLKTINYCLEKSAKVILMSHLGRPKGQRVEKLSLKTVAKRLSELINQNVIFIEDCIGEKTKKIVLKMQPKEIALLENLRFYAEEEKNESSFVTKLAELGEVYINDAFGTAHRAHASNVGIAKILDSAAGFLLLKEIKYLKEAIGNPVRPFIAILGGAKITGKIEVIKNLLIKVSSFLIGGAMSYTFLKAKGKKVGDSLVEEDKIGLAKEILKEAEERKVKLLLPKDHIIADSFSETCQIKVTDKEDIPKGWRGMDIGPQTIEVYKQVIKEAKTIVWNGPVGKFEFDRFKKGTEELAKAITATEAITIIGGGDTISAINQIGLSNKITHLSTGGGASLELLEGKILPAIQVLSKE